MIHVDLEITCADCVLYIFYWLDKQAKTLTQTIYKILKAKQTHQTYNRTPMYASKSYTTRMTDRALMSALLYIYKY